MKLETKTQTNVKQAVPFFGVSNIEESVRYYVDGLGFEEDFTQPGQRIFRTHSAMKAYKYKLKTNKNFEREATRTLDARRELYNASIQVTRKQIPVSNRIS